MIGIKGVMKTGVEELKNVAGNQFDLCVIGGATGAARVVDVQLRGWPQNGKGPYCAKLDD